MAKAKSAIHIIDKMIGDDEEMRQLVADARASSEVAQIVYDARCAAGLTQKDLADIVGTSQSAIARLEDADYEGHSLSMLNRIADALGGHIQLSFVPNEAQHA